jgi:uncharacterized membrane protein
MEDPHPTSGTASDWLRTAALGFAGGLRVAMPFAALADYLERQGPDIADGGPVVDLLASPGAARTLGLAALGEAIFDKTPFPPTRLLPLPLAARVATSGIACALSTLAEGRTSDSGALIGSVCGGIGSLCGYTFRTRLPLPGWLLAVAEDGIALLLARWAVRH